MAPARPSQPCVMLAASLVGCVRSGTAPQSAGSSAGTMPPSAGVGFSAATVQADPVTVTEFYVVPSAIRTQDGTLYSHTVGGSAVSDVLVAVGTDSTFVPPSGGTAVGHLQWFSSASQSASFGSAASGSVETIANVGVPLTSLSLGSLVYAQVEDTLVVFSGGRVNATYPLPTLQPDPAVGGLPAGYKGVFGGVSPGQVSALVPTADGHVLAFTSTGLASAVTDLMTGKTTQLTPVGVLPDFADAGRTVSIACPAGIARRRPLVGCATRRAVEASLGRMRSCPTATLVAFGP